MESNFLGLTTAISAITLFERKLDAINIKKLK